MIASISRAEPRHLPAIRDIYNHEIRTGIATFDVEEKSEADRAAWFSSHDKRHPVVVAEIGSEVVGWACLTRYDERGAYERTVVNSVYVHSLHQGKGIGSSLLGALLDDARRVGHHAIIARITNGNAASVRLHLRFGFNEVGTLREVGWKFDKWHDVLVMQAVL